MKGKTKWLIVVALAIPTAAQILAKAGIVPPLVGPLAAAISEALRNELQPEPVDDLSKSGS